MNEQLASFVGDCPTAQTLTQRKAIMAAATIGLVLTTVLVSSLES